MGRLYCNPYNLPLLNFKNIITFMVVHYRPIQRNIKYFYLSFGLSCWQLNFTKTQKKVITFLTDEPRWRCCSKTESAMTEWFYISLHGTTMNTHKCNVIFYNSLRSILTMSSHIRLDHRRGLFCVYFHVKILSAFLPSSTLATCPA